MTKELGNRSGRQPIIEKTWTKECFGPTGVVPPEKNPGENVTAKTFADISKRIDCANFIPTDKTCELAPESSCLFTRTPSEKLLPHALSHIDHVKEPSRKSIRNALDVTAETAGQIVNHLIEHGSVEEVGYTTREPGKPGAQTIKLATTGENNTTPLVYQGKWKRK